MAWRLLALTSIGHISSKVRMPAEFAVASSPGKLSTDVLVSAKLGLSAVKYVG